PSTELPRRCAVAVTWPRAAPSLCVRRVALRHPLWSATTVLLWITRREQNPTDALEVDGARAVRVDRHHGGGDVVDAGGIEAERYQRRGGAERTSKVAEPGPRVLGAEGTRRPGRRTGRGRGHERGGMR